MDDRDKPRLSFGILAEITDNLQEMDKALWDCLQPMLMRNSMRDDAHRLTGPRPPRLKERFYLVLQNYSSDAFESEVSAYPTYPPNPNFENWLLNLSKRVEDHAIEVVHDIENSDFSNKNFNYHQVSEQEMREAIRDRLREHRGRYSGFIEQTAPPPLPPQVLAQLSDAMMPDGSGLIPRDIREESAEVTEELPRAGDYRSQLLSEYKRATGASNKRIYEASNSGIHKPEFYQWLNGKLSDESRTTKNFEAFLKAKRRPIPRKSSQEL